MSLTCKLFEKGKSLDLVIPELSKEEAKGRELLCLATGFNEEHCILEAQRYDKDFSKDVVGYRRRSSSSQLSSDSYIAIEFYK